MTALDELVDDVRHLPGYWTGSSYAGPMAAWQQRVAQGLGASVPQAQERLLQALSPVTRGLLQGWVHELFGAPESVLPYEVGLRWQHAAILAGLSDANRRQITHLSLDKESELQSLVGVPLDAVRSLAFEDSDPKAQKPPELDLGRVQHLQVRGDCKTLKRLFKAYGWSESVRSLYLPTSLNKPGKFLLEPGALPNLEALHLHVWVNPKRLWEYVENQGPLREFDLSNQVDVAFAEGCARLPWWSALETLRISGSDMGPKQAMAFLDADFTQLRCLQMDTWVTYGGLGKAPKAPAVLRALARRQAPLPTVTRLQVRTVSGSGLEALARSPVFPNLQALYVRTAAFGQAELPYQGSPLLSLQTVLEHPELLKNELADPEAFRSLTALLERGVRVYVDR